MYMYAALPQNEWHLSNVATPATCITTICASAPSSYHVPDRHPLLPSILLSAKPGPEARRDSALRRSRLASETQVGLACLQRQESAPSSAGPPACQSLTSGSGGMHARAVNRILKGHSLCTGQLSRHTSRRYSSSSPASSRRFRSNESMTKIMQSVDS
jgi:hypothetical protein